MLCFKAQTRNEGLGDHTESNRQRENEQFLDSLLYQIRLNITSNDIYRWTVREQSLYFIDMNSNNKIGYSEQDNILLSYPYNNKITVYSIARRRVERELQHGSWVYDFEFVGDKFLVSVGRSFVQVWNISDGILLASKDYKISGDYTCMNCITLSPSGFLYIAGDTIRHLEIITSHSTQVQLKEINRTVLDAAIWASEVCGTKVVLLIRKKKNICIFDVTTFKVTAKLDLSQ